MIFGWSYKACNAMLWSKFFTFIMIAAIDLFLFFHVANCRLQNSGCTELLLGK